jgi:hypothetical protein
MDEHQQPNNSNTPTPEPSAAGFDLKTWLSRARQILAPTWDYLKIFYQRVVKLAHNLYERRATRVALFTSSAVLLVLILFIVGSGYRFRPIHEIDLSSWQVPSPYSGNEKAANKALRLSNRMLDRLDPSGVYIVIDRVRNRLWLRKGDKVLLEAVISAGAGSVLEDPNGKRTWVFDTPTGRFTVVNKRKNPLWTAPDWEFIESGEPLPKNYSERVQEGMLGEYALDLSIPGYMIHGTLYSRLLGRNVSHGCVRVGRDDLRVIWKNVPEGAAVFIF